jgi:trigger factor
LNGLMTTQVEELGGDRVRVTVDVPGHDVHHAVEHALDDLAESVKIPGFRRGRVPRPVLLQRLGKERVMSEAVESHIGGWFWNAVAGTRLRPIENPRYEFELPQDDDADWRFSATVAVQPTPEVPDWTGLEVPYAEPEVPAEALEQALQHVQTTVGDLVPVEGRPASPGDTLVVDLVQQGGEAVERDYVVELGSGRLIDEIEAALVGMSAGESKEVVYETADSKRRTLTATVKEIMETVLPPLDDELARAASEFDTIDELRADLEEGLRRQLAAEAETDFRSAAADALAAAADVNAAGPLVESRARELLRGLARSLQQRGIDANAYFTLTGQTPEQLEQRMRAEATRSVARELVLEAVADKLGLAPSDDDVRSLLREQGESDETIEQVLAAEPTLAQLKQDLRLRLALDRIVADVKRIEPELAAARESIWTPEKEAPAGEQKLWTPGS